MNSSPNPSINPPMDLPNELWHEILKRVVDVKSLCRFRCVCKSWKSLVSSRLFIDDHATVSATTADKAHIQCDVVHYNIQSDQVPVYHSLDQRIKYQHFPFVNRTRYAINDTWIGFKVVGVVHGVVCLSSRASALLWIPITRKYVKFSIPAFEFIRNSKRKRFETRDALGFGFDSSKSCFKVASLSYDRPYLYGQQGKETPIMGPPRCEVFSLEDHLWRKVQFPNDCIDMEWIEDRGFFMNGSIHWRMHRKLDQESCTLLVFDCEHEEFRTMGIPELRKEGEYSGLLGIVNHCGMLSLLVWGGHDASCSLWVMEEYGVSSSWKKLLKVDGVKRNILFNEDGIVYLDRDNTLKSAFKGFNSVVHSLVLEENMYFTSVESNAASFPFLTTVGNICPPSDGAFG